MPIRMTDDPFDPNQQDNSGGRTSPGGTGAGGLGALLPMILSLFGRGGGGGKGKIGLILLLVVGVGAFFLFRGGGCNVSNIANLATGGFLDPKQFEKAKIYEPLADDPNRPALPESANLQRYAPPVGNQGEQGSCVAWSSAYAARTIVESTRTGQSPDNLKFSPAFLYNQIGLEGCQGSYIIKAMEFMTKEGSVPYDQFEYTDQDCTRQPDQQLMNDAEQYRMHGFNRLSLGDQTEVIDLHAIKQNIASGAPVVIGMMVGPSFMQPMKGQDLWQPESGDESMMGFGGHAMCVVGYDDTKYNGAFLLMNSWGPEWGNNGFAWVRYGDFETFVREAYGLDPMHLKSSASTALSCEIALVAVEYQEKKTVTGNYIPLRNAGGNKFETVTPIAIRSKFKIEVKNNAECFIYVFGKETDGTSYTLFPYPTKEDPTKTRYSPFCGITGYRLFPKDKSMTPDSLSKRDVMAVVVSNKELDWNAINQQISQNPQSDYGARLNTVLGNRLARNVRFQSTGKGTMQFTAGAGESVAVACIVEIDKR